jgi:hypothetical protein
MSRVSTILKNLRIRSEANYNAVGTWINEATEPFSISAAHAVDDGLQEFIVESINKPLSSLVPFIKYFKSINGCVVEMFFWQEGGGAGVRKENSTLDLRVRKYAQLCFAWISMVLACHPDKTPQTMKCNLLLFSNHRRFPSDPLALVDRQNCNGGVTYLGQDDVEICVFREEELFKVFVHETFHALGLHGPILSTEQENTIARLSTPCKILYMEVYSEVWARIINSVFVSVMCAPKDNIVYLLDREAQHGWKQCKCVLERISCNSELLRKQGQPTPALEYYCFAGSVMREWQAFLSWCAMYNPPCDSVDGRNRTKLRELGFNLKKANAWLVALGNFVEVGMITAAKDLETKEAEGCAGQSARMSINDPTSCDLR